MCKIEKSQYPTLLLHTKDDKGRHRAIFYGEQDMQKFLQELKKNDRIVDAKPRYVVEYTTL